MKTLTFKVSEDEARWIRQSARQQRISLSEYLRRRLLDQTGVQAYERVKCEFTGAEILRSKGAAPALTTQAVKSMLSDFP